MAMHKRFRLPIVALAASIGMGAIAFAQDDAKEADAKKPKYAIKDVMEKAMKGNSLNKKVLSGSASQEEKLELLDMFISLVENKPPKGDEASWQKFAGSAALAAAKVAVGREDGLAELKTATNCAKCHKEHKPPAKE
jgi:uncharacterized protein YfiM (DUF2279 family)